MAHDLHESIVTFSVLLCEKYDEMIENDEEQVVCLFLNRQFARWKLNISISIEILFVLICLHLLVEREKKIDNIKVTKEKGKKDRKTKQKTYFPKI